MLNEALDTAKAIRGMMASMKVPKANVVVPLIETALLEDDDFLRSRWAEMLLNTFDANCKLEIT